MKSLVYLLSGILLLSSACYEEKDLNLKSPAGTTLSNYFQNEEQALQATIGMYSSLHAQSLWMQFGIIPESLADDVVCGDGNADNIALDRFNVTTTNPFMNHRWTGCYNGIARANIAIEGITSVPEANISASARKQMVAEGKFLRALYYLILVSNYGDVPLYTKPINVNIEEELFPKRTPQNEVWTQVIKDFTDAKADLPVKWDAKYLGRATQGAAGAYLGKALLYYACYLKNFESKAAEAKTYYEKAATELKSVIDSKTYDLDPSYIKGFSDDGDNNIESIFEIQYSIRVGAGTWGENGQGSTRPWLIGTPANGGWKNVIPNRYALHMMQTYEPTDTIRILGNIWGAPGSMYNATTKYYQKLGLANDEAVPVTSWGFRKYQLIPATGNIFGSWVGNNMNFKLMRFADVLLMYAEALNEVSGPSVNAYDAVNRVRARVKLPGLPAGLTKDEFFKRIVSERQIEFFGEDMRWSDIRRWKIGKEVFDALNAYNATPNGDGTKANFNPDIHYYLPVPQTEKDLNKNLTQNPGY